MSPIRDYNGCATRSLPKGGNYGLDERERRLTFDGITAQALLKETEKLLEKWKHPDPYCHPTAPGGGKSHDPAPRHLPCAANPIVQDPSTRETCPCPIWIVSGILLSQPARLLG